MIVGIDDEAGVLDLGGKLARACRTAMVLYLRGPLGAGKTTLARGFLRGMGYGGAVKSPTYTLIEAYEIGARRLYHLDLYRIEDAAELDYLGLRDLYDGEAVMLVEWPERGAGFIPPADVEIAIEYLDKGRRLSLKPLTAAGAALLASLDANFSPG